MVCLSVWVVFLIHFPWIIFSCKTNNAREFIKTHLWNIPAGLEAILDAYSIQQSLSGMSEKNVEDTVLEHR